MRIEFYRYDSSLGRFVSMCERTSMCPFGESTVLTYCKYHTERTWKYTADKALRFSVGPVCHKRTYTLTWSKSANEKAWKRIPLTDVLVRSGWKYNQLFMDLEHAQHHHTGTHKLRNEMKEKENGFRKPWRLGGWKGKWKCLQNTPSLLMNWTHSVTQAHIHTNEWVYQQAGVAAAATTVAHKSQCKHTTNITIFSMLPIVSLRTVRRLWCYVSLNTDLRLMRAHTERHTDMAVIMTFVPFYRSVWFQL